MEEIIIMSGIHKASVFGDFKSFGCVLLLSVLPLLSGVIWIVAMGDVDSMLSGGSVMYLMTWRQRVWGKGHLG